MFVALPRFISSCRFKDVSKEYHRLTRRHNRLQVVRRNESKSFVDLSQIDTTEFEVEADIESSRSGAEQNESTAVLVGFIF